MIRLSSSRTPLEADIVVNDGTVTSTVNALLELLIILNYTYISTQKVIPSGDKSSNPPAVGFYSKRVIDVRSYTEVILSILYLSA